MTEQVARSLFFVCLYPCALLVLFFIWNGGPPSQDFFRIAATLFVIGLASFLTWFVAFVYRALARPIETTIL